MHRGDSDMLYYFSEYTFCSITCFCKWQRSFCDLTISANLYMCFCSVFCCVTVLSYGLLLILHRLTQVFGLCSFVVGILTTSYACSGFGFAYAGQCVMSNPVGTSILLAFWLHFLMSSYWCCSSVVKEFSLTTPTGGDLMNKQWGNGGIWHNYPPAHLYHCHLFARLWLNQILVTLWSRCE